MYNWINKELLLTKADEILSLDEFIPNAFLTVIMESNDSNFKKVIKWIESHQKEYNVNSRERALIGSDLIKLDALEREEVLSFIEGHPEYKVLLK
ncbi:hypothetical protein [Methanobrevibacter sp.]|uniref:hypothetical protein n=1 Tax=Methanobrevibacter sp. TaxID=66852 RepID=UPI0038669FEC